MDRPPRMPLERCTPRHAINTRCTRHSENYRGKVESQPRWGQGAPRSRQGKRDDVEVMMGS